ncbi:MAG: hypothetical protein KKA07_08210, partial [Bacteroidetes bacterium]|nr:hypothetical protein [Bacteroidota bacterium]MBU1719043.1 hypothetical protein [Bacteroidota bacterium]
MLFSERRRNRVVGAIIRVCVLLIFFPGIAFAQVDTMFWFAAPEVTSGHGGTGGEPIRIRISTLDQPSVVTISQPSNGAFIPITVNVPANSVSSSDLTPFIEMIECKPANTILNYGLYISATNAINAYYETDNQWNPDIFALKGRNALGYAFYTPFQNVWPNGTYTPNPYCAFDIVATEDNTQVTITPSQNIVGHNAGIPFTITLNRGQTYSATATSKLANRHLGGSKVVANKKIAVTVKDDSVAKDGCRDIIGDQIVPISIIGTEYAIMKGQVSTGESVFILATQDNTEVSADGNPAVLATINTGQTYRFLITANYHFIKTTKPVYAFHVAGFQCEQGGAILPPLDNCTGSRQVGFTRSKDQPFFLNLMVRVEVDPNADQGFVLNGNGPNTVIPASAFNPIPGNPNWRAAIIDLTAVVPVGVGQIIRNDRDNFHLAMINGQSSTGCSYGYFSSFSSVVLGEDTVLCPNDSLVLDAGPFKDSYLWNDGSTGQYLTVHTPGKYWVDVYNGNCKVTDTINVTYATFPDIDLGDDSLICNGDSYTLDAGAGWTSYLWSDSTTGQSITVDTNGIYWVVVTNLWYCASRDSIEFKLSPDIQVALGNPYICAGESVEITATGASSYQWTPGTGLSTTVGPTVVATPLVTTIYSIIGSDLQNCRDTVPLKITVLGLPLADAGTDKTICYGDSVQLQGSGGFLYSWVPPTGLSDTSVYNPWASPTVTTTYYMTTFGAQGNQFENGDFESIYPGFYSDYTYHTNLNQRGRYYFTDNPKDHFGGYKECGDHTTGTGQMLVVNNSSDVGDHVFCQDIPVIPNTDYAMSLWMQNVHSNTSLPPMQFSINGVSIGNTFTVDTATCVWTQQVEAWYSDTCTVAQFCVINQNSSPSMNGVAFDDISFIKMCYEDDSVTVFVDPLPEAVLSASPVVCSGDSGAIEVTFTGTMPFGLIYGDTITGAVDTIAGIWSNPYSFNVFPGDTNVYYVISVSDANCTNVGSDSAVMPVSTVVLANAGQDTLLCYGESGVLHGSGSGGISPYQYFWSPPTWLLPVDVSDPKVSPLDTIDYILTVTDTNGCFGKDTVRVYVNPPTYVDAGPNKFICFSDSVKIGVIAQGGTAPVSLIWSPTSGLSSATVPTPNASPSDTTEYFLSYYDANGCGGNDSTTVFVNPEILINAGPDHFLCFGESAVLAASASGGRGTLTFQWSPSTGLSDDNALQPIASPVVSTTYILSVSDQSGCVVSDTVVVLVNPELIVDAGANRFVCYGDTIHTTASRTGGIGPFVFLWSPAAGLSNPAILRPVAEPLVSTTYTLLVTDASGCTASDLVVFAVNPEIVLTAGPDKFICFGNSVQIEGVVTGGAAPLNFSWSPSLGLSSTNVADPIASPSVSTTYILSGSDAAGCALADTVIVTVNPEILVSATPDTFICYEDTITLHASFSGGFGALQSGWSPTSGLSAPGSTTTQAFPSVTTNYIFSVQDASGCIVKDTAIVIVNPPILVNCGPDIFLCYGTGVTIPASASGGSAPISVSWSPSAGLSATNITQPYTSPLTTTTYTLSVTDGVGCNVMDSVRVVVNPEILLSAGPDKFICFGDSVILEGAASGGNGAIWTIWSPSAGLDDVFETQPHASPGATTQYIFSVTDQSNCIMRDTVVVTVNPELFVDAGNDVFICYGAPTGLSAAVSGGTPIYSYAWSPSSGLSSTAIANPVANPSDTTVYYFSVTDNSGCTIVDSVEITVNPEIVMTAGPDKFICYGDQVVIEGSASGGFGALNLVWSPTAGL